MPLLWDDASITPRCGDFSKDRQSLFLLKPSEQKEDAHRL